MVPSVYVFANSDRLVTEHSDGECDCDEVQPSTTSEADMVGLPNTVSQTLNVDTRHGGIASRSGRDTDRVDFVRHSVVRAFPHVHHHRGYRLA
jgi:hypothetical protein